jgi:hypothetical protein
MTPAAAQSSSSRPLPCGSRWANGSSSSTCSTSGSPAGAATNSPRTSRSTAALPGPSRRPQTMGGTARRRCRAGTRRAGGDRSRRSRATTRTRQPDPRCSGLRTTKRPEGRRAASFDRRHQRDDASECRGGIRCRPSGFLPYGYEPHQLDRNPDPDTTVSFEVGSNEPRAVWVSDGAESEADAFAGPVLGRKQAAEWLEMRGQRREATRMRLTGSTQPRRVRTVLRPTIVRRISATPRPRARRVARGSSSSRDGPSQQDDSDLADEWIGVSVASARLRVHLLRRPAAMRAAA